MSTTFVLRSPISLPRLFSLDFGCLGRHTLNDLGLAGLKRLIGLRLELRDLFLANLILTHVGSKIVSKLLGDPLL